MNIQVNGCEWAEFHEDLQQPYAGRIVDTVTTNGTTWPVDYATPESRMNPKINMYAMKQRMVQIELCRRWIPVDLLPIYDELVKESHLG